ncbi:hypothetical protein Tco_0963078 [Tanacetum coccineum]
MRFFFKSWLLRTVMQCLDESDVHLSSDHLRKILEAVIYCPLIVKSFLVEACDSLGWIYKIADDMQLPWYFSHGMSQNLSFNGAVSEYHRLLDALVFDFPPLLQSVSVFR